jgi:hypothetical protein
MQGAAVRDTALLIQQAAAELLALLCATDCQTCQLLVAENGLNALASMMPAPPAVPGADYRPDQPEQADNSINNSSSSSTTTAAPQHANTDSQTKSGGVPPLVFGGDADSTGGAAAQQSPHRQVGGVAVLSCSYHRAFRYSVEHALFVGPCILFIKDAMQTQRWRPRLLYLDGTRASC